jgi:photosystem II stability/assembly factor-like uncharacterized protein
MSKYFRLWLVLSGAGALILSAFLPQAADAQTYDRSLFNALSWRNVGPFRGGRATTAVGVPGNPQVYYMGATGGGVWKTEDGGRAWRNISDGFFATGSIGDIAVYGGDPNVIYVGTGEAPVRGQMSSYGDGVYKSMDAGKTWTHAGLGKTRQIARVVIHPNDPNLVYVAAQGSRWGQTDDRGIYRTTDGGATWKRILFSSSIAGASELVMDPHNSNVLYAAFWDMQRYPWAIRSGGPGSGIWKSTDGGNHWEPLLDGLPKIMGKIRLAVSPANPNRVYATIETDASGMFRSDNAGKTWRQVSRNGAIATRPWYYMGVTADPKNAEAVYVSGAALLMSTDGGVTFAGINTPHIDTHSLWINPSNPQNLVNTDDGGASVSFDGGKSWSPIDNQPIAQFYAVQTDDLFPYNLYGGQQDFGPVIVASRTFGGGSTAGRRNYRELAGGESARFGFDPSNPRFVYLSNYLGALVRTDTQTDLSQSVSIWPGQHLGTHAAEMPYRFCWSAPVASSPFDPGIIYHGANVLLRTKDQGVTWTAISPDLTRNDKEHQGRSGLFWHDGSGGEIYGAIFSIVESPHERGTIWVGTDDGLVQLTRDDGRTWTNVTPGDWGEGWVTSIEVSPHNKAKAYAAFSRHRQDDYTPHLFRTNDYGKTWTDLARGLPQADPARVVREDPKREGLLYAATEYAVWISFDDGAHWQSFQQNLPRVPVSDLTVHDNDLIAATEGRGFWIMDDITPLQQVTPEAAGAKLFLFKPRNALRIAGGRGLAGPPEAAEAPGRGPANPPNGVIIHYALAQPLSASESLRLEILDDTGAVVRTYDSVAPPTPKPAAGATGEAGAGRGSAVPPGGQRGAALTTNRGLNRAVWDFRGAPVPGATGQGPMMPSGRYTVRATLGSTVVSQALDIVPDPRAQNRPETERERMVLARKVMGQLVEFNRALGELTDVRTQARDLMKRAQAAPSSTRDAAIQGLIDQLDAADKLLNPFNPGTPLGPGDQTPLHFGLGVAAEMSTLQTQIDGGSGPVTQGELLSVAELEARSAKLRALAENAMSGIDEVNSLAARSGLKPGITRRANSGRTK